jgi:uncharacterized protein with HEPN domain
MLNKELVIEILRQIEKSAQKVIDHFQIIDEPGDFTDQNFLSQYPDVDWKKAKGMRDIITHHYADINAETIFFYMQNAPDFIGDVQRLQKI